MKKNRMKRLLSGVIAGTLCMASLTGCGTKTEVQNNSSKTEAASDGQRELTLCMSQTRWGMSTNETMMEA